MGWTDEQLKAIDFRGGNLLVSAAAGSGKTAVLVERIVKRVTEPDSRESIDSIVVVTFTKAAAEEMKTRLGRAFEELVAKNPNDSHLIKQLSLVDNAKITTIDSFCTYILRNYYNTIGFDPAFRVADNGELSLMKSDVFERIVEARFEKGDNGFRDFVESFAPGKGIGRLSEIVFGLYSYAQSNPWPEEWLDKCLAAYAVDSADEYERLPVVRDTVEYIKEICAECADEYNTALKLCDEPSGPAGYKERLETERDLFITASAENSLRGLGNALSFGYDKLPRATGVDSEIKDRVKAIRDAVKKRHLSVCEKYLADIEEQYGKLCECRPHAEVVINLTKEFAHEYRSFKTEKNVVDFADIEHYALDILIERTDGEIHYTAVADELAREFGEIYIDEYQDSNLVQEYILGAVSRERFGEPNTFMVGDVKQSIYKFRMAKPELFMHKYATYSPDGDKYAKVELHRNFRSRANVLECVNDIFYMSMKKGVGGIDYTDDVRLNYGGDFAEDFDDTTEIIMADKTDSYSTVDNAEIYAHMAAGRIRELMRENPGLSYRDIVILLRGDKKTGPVYASVLANYDIPCVYESSTGYFDTYEIKCIMDMLRIIDNPRQEIALAGVMHSYFAYFTAEELAQIKGRRRKTELYDCVKKYSEREDGLAAKCRDLLAMLEEYRAKSRTEAIRDLISELIYNTGYYDYIGTMGVGSARCANLDMLVQKAREFGQTSYSGLFNFLRYIDKIQKYDVDYGDARTVSEADDVVRIMSIHKSKGLEFSVVIIGGTSQEYNLRDTSAALIYDSTFGIGMSRVDLKRRVRENIAYKNMIARRMANDSIGEELRILYVAMTRAESKLILLGIGGRMAESRWNRVRDMGHMNMAYIAESKSYMDIIMPCALQPVKNGRFQVGYVSVKELMEGAMEPIAGRAASYAETIKKLLDGKPDEDAYNAVCSIFEYQYPYRDVLTLRTKYSVSDLKHRAMEENEELEAKVVPPDMNKPVPRFIKEPDAVSGTFMGNAYHKVFELLDYGVTDDAHSVGLQLDGWVADGRIGEDYRSLIDCGKFEEFIATDLGQSMKAAAARGELFRERPFAMEVGADAIDAAYSPDEKVLVQGIIDAFYFDGDKVFVVDYKTDRVPHGADGEKILADRYRRQLELYCDAIRKVTGRDVGGCYIYSVSLGRAIEL